MKLTLNLTAERIERWRNHLSDPTSRWTMCPIKAALVEDHGFTMHVGVGPGWITLERVTQNVGFQIYRLDGDSEVKAFVTEVDMLNMPTPPARIMEVDIPLAYEGYVN